MINEDKFRKLLSDKLTPELAEPPEWTPGQVVRSTIDYGECNLPGYSHRAGRNRILFKVLSRGVGVYDIEVLASDGVWADRDTQFQKIYSGSPFSMQAEVVPEAVLNPPRERKYVETFKLKYRVTKNDIENGKRQDCKACPHALAVDRAFRAKFRRLRGEVNSGIRHYVTSLVYEPGDGDQNVIAYKASTPLSVKSWFTRFDNRGAVEPGDFEMEFTRFRGRVDVEACEIDV